MANTQRHRYEDGRAVTGAVDSAVVIEIGDLLYLETDAFEPAGQDTNGDGTGDLWGTTTGGAVATAQEAFHDLFAGVAGQASRAGDTADIRVETSGVFEFPCASATFEVFDLVGPAKASGLNLESQKVVAVATRNLAIGYVVKPYTTATTTVMVRIFDVVGSGGLSAIP